MLPDFTLLLVLMDLSILNLALKKRKNSRNMTKKGF